MLVDDCVRIKGLTAVCAREHQKDLKHSSKSLIERKIDELRVGNKFRVFSDRIATPGDGVIIFQGLRDHTAESIKSLEGFKRAFIEEAQNLSEYSLSLLRPTIREEDSEIWFAWNRRRKTDAVDRFFGLKPKNSIQLQANWRDNPWFPRVLEEERQTDLALYPDRYDHIWEGGYVRALAGAYYSQHLAKARSDGRITRLTPDPLLRLRAYWDLGGAGAKADAMSIWITQNVGHDIWVLDYIEGQGQVLKYYVEEMRKRGYVDNIDHYLPHDGVNTNNITGKRYEDHVKEAFPESKVTPIPNQGQGAAMMRIEAGRRLFPRVWFNNGPITSGDVRIEDATEAGRDALGYYHEKKDEHRDVGLGPDHDWSSHAADAFGLMCIVYEAPKAKATATSERPRMAAAGANSWMGS